MNPACGRHYLKQPFTMQLCRSSNVSPSSTQVSGPGRYKEALGDSNSDSPDSSDAPCHHSYLEGLQLLNGLPFFSDVGQNWIQLATGSALTNRLLPSYQHTSPCSPRSSSSDNLHPVTFNGIKDFAIEFTSSAQFLVFPTFSLHRFISTTLPLAFNTTDRNSGITSARACVRAMLLTSNVFGPDVAEAGTLAPRDHVRDIESSLPVILRDMTIDGFEALTMLVSTFINNLEQYEDDSHTNLGEDYI
ncbi:hypothetical protein FSHL1_007678 [Fusarium sambucinum]